MKKSARIAVLFGLVIGLFGAFNAQAASCNSKGCTGLIKRLYLSEKQLYIQPVANLSKLSCTPVSKVYVSLPATNAMFSEMHAMLLGAYLSNEPVFIRTSDKGTCYLSYVVVDQTYKP